MRIVHTEASLGFGGQEMRILTEAQGLQSRGHQLTILCPPESEIYRIARTSSLNAVPLPIGKKRFTGLLALFNWLNSYQPDVINTHSSTDTWLTALAVMLLKKKPAIVRTRHISAPINNNWFTKWLYTRASKHIVTTGENLRETLISQNGYSPSQVTSVRTGIDLGRFKLGNKLVARKALNLDESKIIVGIVATLRSWKGHRYLIEAFSELENLENLQLIIVGDGPQNEALQQLVSKLNLNDSVLFAGRQVNVETWMHAFDIFCLPSYANEGVPQALMQAQACGIPAVTTLIGSIDEAVLKDESALIVSPESISEIKEALSNLIASPEKRTRMGEKAAEFAKTHFSDILMIDSMENIFKSVCE